MSRSSTLKRGVAFLKERKGNFECQGPYHYGFISKEKIWEAPNTACHAGLASPACTDAYAYGVSKKVPDLEGIWTFPPPFKAPCTKTIQVEFDKWLMRQSPWKSVPDKLPVKFITDYGFVITNLSLPSNLIAGLCNATRTCYEYPSIVKHWHEMVSEGVDPALAFVFGHLLDSSGETISQYVNDSGHNVLSASRMSREDVGRFIRGETLHPNKPYKDSYNYQGIQRIWGEGLGYIKYLKETYKKAGETKSGRMFVVNKVRNDSRRPFSEWIEVALAETKKFKEQK